MSGVDVYMAVYLWMCQRVNFPIAGWSNPKKTNEESDWLDKSTI